MFWNKKKKNKQIFKIDNIYFKMRWDKGNEKVLRVKFTDKKFNLPDRISFLYKEEFILNSVSKTYIEKTFDGDIEISNEYHYIKDMSNMKTHEDKKIISNNNEIIREFDEMKEILKSMGGEIIYCVM